MKHLKKFNENTFDEKVDTTHKIDDYPMSVRTIYNRFTLDQKKFLESEDLENFAKYAKRLYYNKKSWKDFFNRKIKELKSTDQVISNIKNWIGE